MTKINGATIYTDTFKVMYYAVSGILTGSLTGIYSYFPDVGGTDFPGYPICTISSPDVSAKAGTIGSNFVTLGGIEIPIELHSKSVKELDELSNLLLSGLINAEKINTSIYASGLSHLRVNSSKTTTNTLGNDRVHTKTFGVTYDVHY